MQHRSRYSSEFKAKAALAALTESKTLAELASELHGLETCISLNKHQKCFIAFTTISFTNEAFA